MKKIYFLLYFLILTTYAYSQTTFKQSDLFGNWVCKTTEFGNDLLIYIELKPNGETYAFFYNEKGEFLDDLHGTWTYNEKQKKLSETFNHLKGCLAHSTIEWFNKDHFCLTIIYNCYDNYTGKNIKRHYYRFQHL